MKPPFSWHPLLYGKIPVISPGPIQLCKGFFKQLASEKYFDKEAFFWPMHGGFLRVNNCFKGAVACLYQEGAITVLE